MTFRNRNAGFTLVELLVSMGILSVLLLLLTTLLGTIQQTWVSAQDRVGQFREARVAFDIITKNASQASLNTSYDYKYDPATNFPSSYERRSELHFKTCPASELAGEIPGGTPVGHALFFQAPLGFSTRYRNLNNLFNGRGYFVVYGDDLEFRPDFVRSDPKYRFRLMEFRPPAEENQVFADGQAERENDQEPQLDKWWRQSESSVKSGPFFEHVHPLAENIIALVVSPRDTLEVSGDDRRNTFSRIASNFEFDSNSIEDLKYAQQVPPLMRLTMIAVDETAGIRQESVGTPPQELIFDQLFKNTSKYDEDIATLEEELGGKGINYKIFSTIVMMRSSRWSDFEIDEIK